MKDEIGGNVVTKFVVLRTVKKLTEQKKCVIKIILKFNDYKIAYLRMKSY